MLLAPLVDQLIKAQIKIAGVVQGVGFRPFVYRLAKTHALSGFVRNSGGMVQIEVEGNQSNIHSFIEDLTAKAPPLAVVKDMKVEQCTVIKPANNAFTILESTNDDDHDWLLLPSDTATCADCLHELFDKNDRRFQYPFINCVNCGPRFTIINELPYDRHLTTMSEFKMCGHCAAEYEDPLSRRFHAQPNACFDCGPRLSLIDPNTHKQIDSANIIERAKELLLDGKIVALKGLGGFQLICDASNELAVNNLRQRKVRASKPFAVMMQNLEMIKEYCFLSSQETTLLNSNQAPIVLLEKKPHLNIAKNVAANTYLLGVMLPYTPMHHLLATALNRPMIVTSGNISEEPIAFENEQALQDLAPIADYFLLHNRKIAARYDDSVTKIVADQPVILRRARSYAPQPLEISFQTKQTILSVGGQLKNTFCFLSNNQAFVSPHIGDLDNLDTLNHCQNTIEKYKQLFKLEEQILACDLHPDYASTKLAQQISLEKQIPLIHIQHHHAHIVSCMAEHNLSGPVIGVAFDGAGYGTDGNIWGGEFIIADQNTFTRYACLEPVRMPGGEQAIKHPWRMALSYISQENSSNYFDDFQKYIEKQIGFDKVNIVFQQIQKGFNSPITSSCGRLFDAVSSILGICHQASYEGQAAVELESAAQKAAGSTENTEKQIRADVDAYPYNIIKNADKHEAAAQYHIAVKDMLKTLAADQSSGKSINLIAWQFHLTLVRIIVDICTRMREKYSINNVCLSGGVFQNNLLLRAAIAALQLEKFIVHFQHKVPSNDGGISLGQAIIAAAQTGNLHSYQRNR